MSGIDIDPDRPDPDQHALVADFGKMVRIRPDPDPDPQHCTYIFRLLRVRQNKKVPYT
jgi:hypothetical protein